MAGPTYTELATALAFLLQKWKDAGASESDTSPFDDMLFLAAAQPKELAPAKPVTAKLPDPPKGEPHEDLPEDYRPAVQALDTPDEPDPDWAVGTGDQELARHRQT